MQGTGSQMRARSLRGNRLREDPRHTGHQQVFRGVLVDYQALFHKVQRSKGAFPRSRVTLLLRLILSYCFCGELVAFNRYSGQPRWIYVASRSSSLPPRQFVHTLSGQLSLDAVHMVISSRSKHFRCANAQPTGCHTATSRDYCLVRANSHSLAVEAEHHGKAQEHMCVVNTQWRCNMAVETLKEHVCRLIPLCH